MKREEREALDNLARKVHKQEETIAQLIEIIAATNQRITQLHEKQRKSFSL
ncbi:hypothetical protein [Virgibacillus sp. SK37]|uniref:hypothetical protein n=1 Tax=Virgibacillus sp. SK37 TaxID=403957 RepID=UPI0004D1DB63|nr:hypothetical protein [Virgibacillus sp. SK37]AIF45490.1 hypothetical protein X953_14065 [Virgibacillus sp. SK37]